jgi:hypothetical protein
MKTSFYTDCDNGDMSLVAWAALLLSLLSLFLFVISNYKKLYSNTIQFLLSPKLDIRLETGPITSEDGETTVGGSPDGFERELIELQNRPGDGPIKIPLSKLQHPDDHSEFDHFDTCIRNNDGRIYEGDLTIAADLIITNRHPNLPSEFEISHREIEKQMLQPGKMLNSETLGPKIKYDFSEKVLLDNGRFSSSWYINRDILTADSNKMPEIEIEIKFKPRLTPPNFPRWIPEFVGPIELREIDATFMIKDDTDHS